MKSLLLLAIATFVATLLLLASSSIDAKKLFRSLTSRKNKNNNKNVDNTTTSVPPLVNLVDVFIGTGSFGFGIGEMNPGAQVPFGCQRLGPATNLGLEPFQIPQMHLGGYYYYDTHMLGFTATSTVGAGASDYGNFLVTAVRLDETLLNSGFPDTKLIKNGGYVSKFSHDTEFARPGYYSVNLDTPNVFAEVTVAGTHSGIHRYTCYPDFTTKRCAILFDICHATQQGFLGPFNAECKSAQIYNWTLEPTQRRNFALSATMTLHGSLSGRSPKNGGVRIYFYAEVSFEDPTSTFSDRVFLFENDTFSASTASTGSQSTPTTSHSLGMILMSNTTRSEFIVRTGISFISADFAMANMYQEQTPPGHSPKIPFDTAKMRTMIAWEEMLGRFAISADTKSYNEPAGVFYSAVYRSHLAPTTFSEFDGSYIGMDFRIHNVKADNGHQQKKFYTDLSIWDIYRSQQPLLLFSAPSVLYDTVASMLSMQKQYELPPVSRKRLPQWVIANVESDCMTGWHSSSIILDAISKNVSWFAGIQPGTGSMVDLEYALNIVAECIYLEVSSSMPAPGYFSIGNAGKTLEFAIDAGQVVYTAERYGFNKTIADRLRPYAEQSWRNIWESENKIPCPRKTGSISDSSNFDCPKLFGKVVDWIPYPFESRYVEASAVDSRWMVPQDLDGLFDFLQKGSPNPNNNRNVAASYLESFFSNTFNVWPNKLLNTTLQNAWYDPTNEPTLLTPFIFCMMGPEYAHRTSYYVKRILETFSYYGVGGNGGNEDYGAMSSADVFSYIGIYPIIPTTNYSVFTPMFNRLSIKPPGIAFWLTVVCTGRSDENDGKTYYVSSVKINGKDIGARAWFNHQELYENMGPYFNTTIEMDLSTTPVTVGNPSQPAWKPTTAHAECETPERKEVVEEVLKTMVNQKTDNGKKRMMKKRELRSFL